MKAVVTLVALLAVSYVQAAPPVSCAGRELDIWISKSAFIEPKFRPLNPEVEVSVGSVKDTKVIDNYNGYYRRFELGAHEDNNRVTYFWQPYGDFCSVDLVLDPEWKTHECSIDGKLILSFYYRCY